MAEGSSGPPVVLLPRRLDRRLRLGPFPSARDALKFLSYAAAGALLAPVASPFLWLPVVGVGFLVSVWTPDGVALDELAAQGIRWHAKRLGGGVVSRTPPLPNRAVGGFIPLEGGRRAAVVRASGVPLAYRPPSELERAFDLYRTTLREVPGPLAVRSYLVPLPSEPFLPPSPSEPRGADRAAEAGYQELVTLLCRRRSVRRVDLALCAGSSGPESIGALERDLRTLVASLETLGVRPRRLRGPALAGAARGFGWRSEGVVA